MPDPRTTYRWARLRAPLAWETVRDTGCWLYQRNRITGERRVRRSQPGGHQPTDQGWLRTGEWTRPPPVFGVHHQGCARSGRP